MDISTPLLVLMAMMAINQAVLRVDRFVAKQSVFLVIQLLNMLAGTLVIVRGLPGFENIRVLHWVIGLMFFLHMSRNTQRRAAWLKAQDDLRLGDLKEEE